MRGPSGRVGFWYRLVILVLRPLLVVLTRRQWRGQQHVPSRGGLIVAANHISHVDPLVCAHFLIDAGRLPRFLAKVELFQTFFVKRVMYGAGQIPVYRHSATAADALRDAVVALKRGECVVIYPEGTIGLDPGFWPMRAHTGVGRLALETGVPVIPLAQWGAQDIEDRNGKLHLWPPHTVALAAGPPVDLAAYSGQEPTPKVVALAVEQIMADLRRLVGELRGETPPARVYDPRAQEREERSA